MRVGKAGLNLCASFESFRSHPYRLGDGKVTIGFGETQGVTMNTGPWTREYAWARFVKRMNEDYGAAVNRFLDKHNLVATQNEFDALVSLAYNLGTGVFVDGSPVGATMRSALRADRVTESTFTTYRMPGSKFEQGLLRRRKAEWALYSKKPALTKKAKWRIELALRRSQLKREKNPGTRKYLIRRINELKRALK